MCWGGASPVGMGTQVSSLVVLPGKNLGLMGEECLID